MDIVIWRWFLGKASFVVIRRIRCESPSDNCLARFMSAFQNNNGFDRTGKLWINQIFECMITLLYHFEMGLPV